MPTIFRDPVIATDLTTGAQLDLQTPNIITDILDGWNNTAGVDASFTSKGGGDGARAAGAWLTKEKYMTLGGAVVHLGSRESVEVTRDILWGFFQPEANLAIDRTVAGAQRRMYVRVYDAMDSDDVVEEGFRFVIPLVALDPLKYSPTSVTVEAGAFSGDEWYRLYEDTAPYYRTYDAAGFRLYEQPVPGARPTSAQVVNDGNATSSRVKITVYGELFVGDWSIVNETTGQSQIIDATIPAGRALVIDSYEETTTMEGNDLTDLTYGDWMRTVPGVNTFRLFTGIASDVAYMTIESYSSWR